MSLPTPDSLDEPDQARGNRSERQPDKEAPQEPSSADSSPSYPTEPEEADQARGNRSRRQAHQKSSSTGSFSSPPFDSDETDQARGNRSGTQFRRVRPGKQEYTASPIPPVSPLRKERTVLTSEPISSPLSAYAQHSTSLSSSSSESPSTHQLPLGSTQPIEFSTSGHTTYEIPLRPKKVDPGDNVGTVEAGEKGGGMGQEGLKLRLELNLDMDIELKASIHGDIVLAVL
ncbi:hypothetical protein MMC26_000039 [Xylographa opegraphella]|nr:hypothetical protein [Xylographa opegraphella]